MELNVSSIFDSSSPEKRVLKKMALYFDKNQSDVSDIACYFVINGDFESIRVIIQMKLGPKHEEVRTISMFMFCFGLLHNSCKLYPENFIMADFIMLHSSQQQRIDAFKWTMCRVLEENNPLMEHIEFLLTLRAKYEIEVDGDIFDQQVDEHIIDKLLRNGYGKYAHLELFKCIVTNEGPEGDFKSLERSQCIIEEFGISLAEHGPVALKEAVKANNHLMISFLINQGVNIDPCLLGFDVFENIETMKILLEHGSSTENVERFPVGFFCSPEGEAKLVLLLQHCVQIDYTYLHDFVTPRFVRFLLKNDHGAAMNPLFINGVFQACCGHAHFLKDDECIEILTMLINAGVDFTKLEPINKKTCYKKAIALQFGKQAKSTSSLGKAVAKNDKVKFTELISRSTAGVKRKMNAMPYNALHVAAKYGRTEFARKMVELGADTNAMTPDGENAFHIAAAAGHRDTLLALMKKP